jgi:tetratricopeptide (TPR) repeat protein
MVPGMGTHGSGGDPTQAVGLLERSSLLDELSGLLAGVAGAGGRVVLVSGEAGIGKSALVRRFAELHSAHARFLLGTCDPLLTPRALGPLHDIARQTSGALAERLAAGDPREAVFAAFLDELEQTGQRRTVVVVEDAHWADEATLDLLVFVGRRLERVPALLVVTYRDDELGADHPLRLALASLAQGVARRVPLPPLSVGAVAELARRQGRSAAGLYALTGGNPLLVTELLAAGEPGVPGTVRDLALVRLARLPMAVRDVVRLVAVVPGNAELWLLERMLGPDAAMVEAGIAAGLLVLGEETVGFRHELLRLAVEGSLTTFSGRELNRRILQALADTPGIDVARLAHHARQAGDPDAVLRHAPEAARQAAAVGAHWQAAEHYRAALVYADHLAPLVRAELLESYSLEAYLSGLAEQALTARRTALETREAAGDAEKAGENLRWLSRLYWWTGNRTEAERAAARAIAVLETVPPGRQLAMAYSNRSQLEMVAHRSEPAVAWGSRAMDLARRLGDTETLAHALTNSALPTCKATNPVARWSWNRRSSWQWPAAWTITPPERSQPWPAPCRSFAPTSGPPPISPGDCASRPTTTWTATPSS